MLIYFRDMNVYVNEINVQNFESTQRDNDIAYRVAKKARETDSVLPLR